MILLALKLLSLSPGSPVVFVCWEKWLCFVIRFFIFCFLFFFGQVQERIKKIWDAKLEVTEKVKGESGLPRIICLSRRLKLSDKRNTGHDLHSHVSSCLPAPRVKRSWWNQVDVISDNINYQTTYFFCVCCRAQASPELWTWTRRSHFHWDHKKHYMGLCKKNVLAI